MSGRWAGGSPPDEAYSRLTDPHRFAPLHAIARELLDRLAGEYLVERVPGTELDPDGRSGAQVEALVPAAPAGALEIVFTAFPGLFVRVGGTEILRLPGCGCDACDEDVPELEEQLRERVDALVAGESGESLERSGDTWFHMHWYPSGRNGHGVEGAQLAALRARLPLGELSWAPWPRR